MCVRESDVVCVRVCERVMCVCACVRESDVCVREIDVCVCVCVRD